MTRNVKNRRSRKFGLSGISASPENRLKGSFPRKDTRTTEFPNYREGSVECLKY